MESICTARLATSPEELRLPTVDPDTLALTLTPMACLDLLLLGHHRRSQGRASHHFSIMASANGLLELMGLGEKDVYPIPGRSRISVAHPSRLEPSRRRPPRPFRDLRSRDTRAGWLCTNPRSWEPLSRSSGPIWTQPAWPVATPLSVFAIRLLRRRPRPHRDPRRDAVDVRRAPCGELGTHRVSQRHVCGTDDSIEIVTTSVGRPASGVSVRVVDPNGDCAAPLRRESSSFAARSASPVTSTRP